MFIGISGKKGAGKDTFANFLIKYLPKTTISHFADSLKDSCAIMEGVNRNKYETCKEEFIERFNMSRRDFLKVIGKVGRDIYPKMWVDSVLNKNYPGYNYVLIPDLRFINEFNKLKSLGGITIRVTRPQLQSNDTHESEVQLDNHKFDFNVVADTKDELDELAKQIAKQIMNK